MTQQHTPAAGSGQTEWDGTPHISNLLHAHHAYEIGQLSSASKIAAELQSLSLNNLGRALQLKEHETLLRDHRENQRALGALEPRLDEAFASALIALGVESHAVKQQGLELAAMADRFQDQWQRPDETPGAGEQCGGVSGWRLIYSAECVPCDLCTAQPPKGGAA